METVYYRDVCLGYCPVKKYFEQYAKDDKDTKKEKEQKDKILINIDAKIRYIVQNSGLPVPPISYPLKKYSYFEIKHRKDKNILIRIFYFRHKDKIVLLNALEKPDNYDTDKEKKKIDKQLKITENYKNKFESNPKLYEKYNQKKR